jgi:hypothetical protein
MKIFLLRILILLSYSVCYSNLIDSIEYSRPINHEAILQSPILNVYLPFQENEWNSTPSEQDKKPVLLLQGLLKEIESSQGISNQKLSEIANLLSDYSLIEELNPLCQLVQELQTGNYDSTDVKRYLSWSLRLELSCLHNTSQLTQNANELYGKIIRTSDYEITIRDSNGHSPSYFLVDNETKTPFAILKQSEPEFFSSFKQHLPNMVISAPVWEHELVGYEQDLLLGLNRTPATVAVRFINHKNEVVRGTIQEYITEAKDAGSYYSANGLDILKSIPKSEVQLTAISGMLKGLSAAHMGNYLIHPETAAIYEVDLEEMLLPFNQIPDSEAVVSPDPANAPLIRKSIILCRLWILGLPQSDKPFDRAPLLLLAHPKLSTLLMEYQQQASHYSSISKESWNAQLERVQQMQEFARQELQKESPELTPRDLYFMIFGGEHLFKIAKEKNYPAIIAFNNLISDPYQHILKDFAHPELIPSYEPILIKFLRDFEIIFSLRARTGLRK